MPHQAVRVLGWRWKSAVVLLGLAQVYAARFREGVAMTDPTERGDLGAGEREMTSADLTAHDAEHGQEPDRTDAEEEPSQQRHHDAETDEDTASGGAPD
jgi:hypothetical protein